MTIPAQIRRSAGIAVGSALVVYLEDGRIVLETREQLAERIRRDVRHEWVGAEGVVDELIADRRSEVAGTEAE